MAAEKRIDPEDGTAYTWEELAQYYKGKYKQKDLDAYWFTCKIAKGTKSKAAGAAAKPSPKAKVKVKAKSDSKPSSKTDTGSKWKPVGRPGDTSAYITFRSKLRQMVKSEKFVQRRGDAFHVLFKAEEMEPFFQRIKDGEVGKRMKDVESSDVKEMSNLKIWKALLRTLKFDGVDFEHTYGIVGGHADQIDLYTFPETVILTQTQILLPVIQYVSPMMPGIPGDKVAYNATGQPILAVGMIGDCVKGAFFKHLEDNHPKDAAELRNPVRLCSKIGNIVKAMNSSKFTNVSIQASLAGAGAFGGNGAELAKDYVVAIGKEVEAFETQNVDEVLLYGPKDWYTGPLEALSTKVKDRVKAVGFGSADDKNRIGELPLAKEETTRVIVGGFDPCSLAPHGMVYRTVSLEGQLSHTTDMLWRIGYYKKQGHMVSIAVESGAQALAPGKEVEKASRKSMVDPNCFVTDAAEYSSWRYLKTLTNTDNGKRPTLQQKEDRRPNGDCLAGWSLV